MKIGIIAAMEEELSLLLANLLDAQEHQVLSKTYYTGRFGKHEL
ncbi:TPA: 5'-methylthioadenosine/S-adenosylhomocysteine nucleosidase, partial [Streptococcus pyogenes]